MGARPTSALWGIGKKTADKLALLGIVTVEDLARADAEMLAERIGPTTGPVAAPARPRRRSDEVDATPYVARGHGREETFQEDLTDWADVERETARIARRVVEDIEAEGRPAVRVELKLRYRPFFTLTRSHKLPEPTSRSRRARRRGGRAARPGREGPAGPAARRPPGDGRAGASGRRVTDGV